MQAALQLRHAGETLPTDAQGLSSDVHRLHPIRQGEWIYADIHHAERGFGACRQPADNLHTDAAGQDRGKGAGAKKLYRNRKVGYIFKVHY